LHLNLDRRTGFVKVCILLCSILTIRRYTIGLILLSSNYSCDISQ
jgi:hypothetical protein